MTGASKRPRYISPRWYAGLFVFSVAWFLVAAVSHYFRSALTSPSVPDYVWPVVLWSVFSFLVLQVAMFLMWERRVIWNLRALGVSGQRFWSGWYLLFWFVPLFNLFMPYQIIQEVWRASDPSPEALDGISWKDKKGSPLVMWWWGLWMFPLAAGVLGMVLSVFPFTDSILDFSLPEVYQCAFVSGLVLLILVVLQITRRQDAKYALLGAQAENVPPV